MKKRRYLWVLSNISFSIRTLVSGQSTSKDDSYVTLIPNNDVVDLVGR